MNSKENDKELEEYKEKLLEDIRWLQLSCPKMPEAKDVESTAQTLGILKALNPFLKNLTRKDIIKASLIGFIASNARKVDDKRFQEISPYAYLHLAHYWTDPDDDEEYGEFVKRISG